MLDSITFATVMGCPNATLRNQRLMDQQILLTYQQSSERAVEWLAAQLKNDGSLQASPHDLACYYKAPYLFFISGKIEEANRMLSYIHKTFGLENGDFASSKDGKSENVAFVEYWAYMNGWIALAAQKMGRFDVAYPASDYLQSFFHPTLGGFTTRNPYGQSDNTVDVLTTAHLGLVALYLGNLQQAKSAGQLMQTILSLQPNTTKGFFLRLNDKGNLITEFPEESALFFFVSTTQPNQAYFMLGYPIAFLGKLYSATQDSHYLDTAKEYLERLLTSQGNLRTFHYSHKVAWGSAMISKFTKDPKYTELATSIADYLVTTQNPDGRWLTDQPAYTFFDQTAEIAIWMKEIRCELSKVD